MGSVGLFCLRFYAQILKSAVYRAHPAPEESSREVGTDARPPSPSWRAAQPQCAPEFAQTQPTRCLLIGAAVLLHRNFFLSLFFNSFSPLLSPSPSVLSLIHLK